MRRREKDIELFKLSQNLTRLRDRISNTNSLSNAIMIIYLKVWIDFLVDSATILDRLKLENVSMSRGLGLMQFLN